MTAKVTKEEQSIAKHHMIDIMEIKDSGIKLIKVIQGMIIFIKLFPL